MRIPKKNKECIERLESATSKNDYVVDLIEEDIKPSILKISTIKEILKETLGKHSVQKIIFFGSYARGDANSHSDVDILCDKGDISTLLQKEAVQEELEEKLQKKVDLIFTTAEMPDYFKSRNRKGFDRVLLRSLISSVSPPLNPP